jgi:hypothetical protein
MQIRPVGAELSHGDGRTDRQVEMTKLIVVFRKFVEAPKMIRYVIMVIYVIAGTMSLC